jgi:hypothetical protein
MILVGKDTVFGQKVGESVKRVPKMAKRRWMQGAVDSNAL